MQPLIVHTADGDTSLAILSKQGGAFSFKPVVVGDTDSGGVGFRMLRVAN